MFLSCLCVHHTLEAFSEQLGTAYERVYSPGKKCISSIDRLVGRYWKQNNPFFKNFYDTLASFKPRQDKVTPFIVF